MSTFAIHHPHVAAPYPHRRLNISIAAILVLFSHAAWSDEAVDLGSVNATANDQFSQMFATPTPIDVEHTPLSQKRSIQLFNPDATEAETTITAGRMQALPPNVSFTQALATLPNVVVQTNGNSMTGDNVYINGLPKTLINFTVDDVPLNDGDNYTFYSNEFIPTILVSGIKYYSSAASAAIPGTAAFAGSVQTYSKDPGPDMFVEPLVGTGSFGMHNYGILVNTGVIGAKSAAPTTLYVYQNKIAMDGYFQNTPANQEQTIVKSMTALGNASLTLYYSRNNETFNYYDGCTAANIALQGNSCNLLTNNVLLSNGKVNTNYAPWNYNTYIDSMAYAKLVLPLSHGAQLTDQLYFYNGNGYGAGAVTYSPTLLQPNGLIGKVAPPVDGALLSNSYNITKRWGDIFKVLIPIGSSTIEAGVWYNHNHTDHDGQYLNSATNQYVGSSFTEFVTTDTTEPYFNVTYKFNQNLSLVFGAKYLYMDRSFLNTVAQAAGQTSSYDTKFDVILPSVGLNYKLNPTWSTYANYTKNANPPGYNQFYIAPFNPNLTSEQADVVDIGTQWKVGGWTSSVDAFRLNFSNYILSSSVIINGVSQTELTNGGSALNQGISWQNNWLIDNNWSGYANVGVLNAKFTTLNQQFPYAPNNTLSVGAIYNNDAITGQIGAVHVANSFYSVGNYPTNTMLNLPSYTMVNASLGYTFTFAPMNSQFGFKDATVALAISNLTNTSYITSYYNATTQQLNEPRSYYLSVNARF